MSQDPAAPLFYPFLSGALDWPKATDRALVLGAPGDLRLPAEFKADVALVQGFRPDFLRLQRAGLNVA
ncbi:methyltransferase, partial [Escherichia coli]|nr:methyltransferase [Escherichia coli]